MIYMCILHVTHAQTETRGIEMPSAPLHSRCSLDSLPEGELCTLCHCKESNCVYELALLFQYTVYISGTSHLRHLFECLHDFYDWKTLGLYLGISYSMLQAIEMDHRKVSDCKMAMLQHWLCTGRADKRSLLLALRKME